MFIKSPQPDMVIFSAKTEISDLHTSIIALLLKQDVF